MSKRKECKALTFNLNTLRDEVYQDAVEHGLWEDEATPIYCGFKVGDEYFELIKAMMDLHEARLNSDTDESDKIAHCAEELANVIIMCLSVAGKMGIDIDEEVKRKMEINKGRPEARKGGRMR